MSEPAEIVEQITAAFAAVPIPPRDALMNHHCCECLETSEAYDGKRWQEITLEELLRGREVALLSATAWRYYLPAFPIWSIRAPDAVDVLLDNLVSQLEPPSEGRGVPEWFAERSVGFSPEQRQAIVAFLDWYRVRDDAIWRSVEGEPPGGVYNAIRYWTRKPRDGRV
jgi:hypothetical protein